MCPFVDWLVQCFVDTTFLHFEDKGFHFVSLMMKEWLWKGQQVVPVAVVLFEAQYIHRKVVKILSNYFLL